jgi:P4 family phage/plasmid primase-like protien
VTDMMARDSAAWSARADELALWVWRNLVNRTDVWGQYRLFNKRTTKTRKDGSTYVETAWTLPAKRDRGRKELTLPILARHFHGRSEGHVVGLHSTSAESTSRSLTIDIDKHEGDDASPETNLHAALYWYNKLTALGLRVLLTSSNGAGGYHLRLIFDLPLKTWKVHYVGQHLVSDFQSLGLEAPPEIFPKQIGIDGDDEFGNWIRLPGRHHTKDFWSEVWNGTEWLAGEAAVGFILAFTPNAIAELPEGFLPVDPPSLDEPAPETGEPTAPPADVGAAKDKARTATVRRVNADRARAVQIIAHLPNDNLPYADYFRVAAALHSVDRSPAMMEEFIKWSSKSKKHVREKCESDWSYLKDHRPKKVTLGTLVKMARDAGLASEAPWTEQGNTQKLVAAHGMDMKYCPQRGLFFVYDGGRWRPDETGQVARWAKGISRGLWGELNRQVDGDLDDKALIKHCIASETARGIAAMMKLAQSEADIVRPIVQFDADPFLLNVLNGTINLRDGAFRPHDRGDLITKLAPVAYDPNARCPRFDQFMVEIMNTNHGLIDYLARVFGMGLSGDITVQEAYFLWGGGANGKNVLIDTVLGIMGDYAGIAPPGLLTTRTNDEHPCEIADLAGKRLVVSSETEEDAKLRVQLVKRMTGDPTLKARFMRQDYFEFPRTHKTILVTNNKPLIRESTNAVWRRIRLVPFTVTIPAEKQDPQLTAKLRDEWPGILAWAVRGCLDWQRNGMQTPEEVIYATQSYQFEQDVLGEYIEARCVRGGENVKVGRAELFCDYQSWAKQTGEHFAMERNAFFERVRRIKGVSESQWRPLGSTTPIRGFRGIGLLTMISDSESRSSETEEIDV